MQRPISLALLVLTLAACGGGGGGDSSTTATATGSGVPASPPPVSPPPPAPVPPPPSPPPPSPPTTTGSCTIPPDAVRTSFLQLVNTARASNRNCGTTTYGATGGLAWNLKLAAAATEHSEDMAKNNLFSHTGSDGSTVATRVTRAGYTWSMVGENIAYAFPASSSTQDSTMQQWLNSPGHCANIMNPQFTELAVACAEGSAAAGNGDRRYWTMVLARP